MANDARADVADYGVDALDPENLIAAFLDNGERAAKLVQTLKAYGWTFVAARPLPEGMETTENYRQAHARAYRAVVKDTAPGAALLRDFDRLGARLAEAEAEKAAAVESAAVLARAFEERVAARVAAEREHIKRLIEGRIVRMDKPSIAQFAREIMDAIDMDGKTRAAAIRARGGDNG